MATQWWNPFDGDVIPGINVKNAVKQVATGQDQDIFEGVTNSNRAGQLQMNALPDWGVRPVSGGTGTPLPDPTPNDDGSGTGTGTGGLSRVAADPDAALRNTLRAEIMARGGDIESVYSSLFGELESLVRSRDQELEGQYGNQFKKAADTYAGALPEIETSYAAIGASDSTDQTDAKGKAKSGYDETTRTIGENKASDKAKLGAYKKEQEAKISTDKEAAKRNVARVNETTDVSALRGMRNDLESNIGSANVTRATLGSNGSARQAVTGLTQDAGRFDAAVNALDSIIKSSMSGSVKEAAVKAIADNSGLSEEEKAKVNQQYGNVYAEQQAL